MSRGLWRSSYSGTSEELNWRILQPNPKQRKRMEEALVRYQITMTLNLPIQTTIWKVDVSCCVTWIKPFCVIWDLMIWEGEGGIRIEEKEGVMRSSTLDRVWEKIQIKLKGLWCQMMLLQCEMLFTEQQTPVCLSKSLSKRQRNVWKCVRELHLVMPCCSEAIVFHLSSLSLFLCTTRCLYTDIWRAYMSPGTAVGPHCVL